MVELDLLVWNLWHGLHPYTHPLLMRPIEAPWELLLRLAGQESFLRQHFTMQVPTSDHNLFLQTACFQELNPLHFRISRLRQLLGAQAFAATGNSGPRVGPLGLPMLLREGLGTVVVGPAQITQHLQRNLSGDAFEAKGPWSLPVHFQIGERRVAQKIKIKAGGAKFTLCNVHLHNGASGTQSQSRRLNEVRKLLRFLAREFSLGRPVIVCGDFNCDPQDAELMPLREAGFVCVTEDLPPTWHPRLNPGAMHSSKLARKPEDKRWDEKSHLFDQIWVKGAWDVETLRRVADDPYYPPDLPRGVLGFTLEPVMLSDHFAIHARLKLRK